MPRDVGVVKSDRMVGRGGKMTSEESAEWDLEEGVRTPPPPPPHLALGGEKERTPPSTTSE